MHIPGPVGPLEVLLDRPGGRVRAAVVFGHPHPRYGGSMRTKELVVIDAADHLFDGHTTEVGDAIEDLLGDYEEPN